MKLKKGDSVKIVYSFSLDDHILLCKVLGIESAETDKIKIKVKVIYRIKVNRKTGKKGLLKPYTDTLDNYDTCEKIDNISAEFFMEML